MGYSNKEADQLFDTEFKEGNLAKRAQMWHRIQQLLMAELPALPLFEYPVLNIASANFVNVVSGPMGYLEGRENVAQK